MPFDVIDTATAPLLSGSFGAPRTSYGRTLAKFQAQLTRKLKGRDDITGLTADWINDAYREVCAEVDFPELSGQLSFTSTLGQASYKLPVGVYVLRQMYYKNPLYVNGGYELTKITEEIYRASAVVTPVTTYPPTQFFQYHENGVGYVVLWPTPNSASFSLSFTFKVTPQPLVNSTDSPILDERWHYPIYLRAVAIALEDLDDEEGSIKALDKYLASIRPKETKESEALEGQVFGISVPRKWADLRKGRTYDDWCDDEGR
jgi:hypothetical protein